MTGKLVKVLWEVVSNELLFDLYRELVVEFLNQSVVIVVKVGGETLEVSPKDIELLIVLSEASEFIYSSTTAVRVTVHAV